MKHFDMFGFPDDEVGWVLRGLWRFYERERLPAWSERAGGHLAMGLDDFVRAVYVVIPDFDERVKGKRALYLFQRSKHVGMRRYGPGVDPAAPDSEEFTREMVVQELLCDRSVERGLNKAVHRAATWADGSLRAHQVGWMAAQNGQRVLTEAGSSPK